MPAFPSARSSVSWKGSASVHESARSRRAGLQALPDNDRQRGLPVVRPAAQKLSVLPALQRKGLFSCFQKLPVPGVLPGLHQGESGSGHPAAEARDLPGALHARNQQTAEPPDQMGQHLFFLSVPDAGSSCEAAR